MKSVLGSAIWTKPILISLNEVRLMQANTLSSYNTQTVVVQHQKDVVKRKPTCKSSMVSGASVVNTYKSSGKACSSNFDFAGVAG